MQSILTCHIRRLFGWLGAYLACLEPLLGDFCSSVDREFPVAALSEFSALLALFFRPCWPRAALLAWHLSYLIQSTVDPEPIWPVFRLLFGHGGCFRFFENTRIRSMWVGRTIPTLWPTVGLFFMCLGPLWSWRVPASAYAPAVILAGLALGSRDRLRASLARGKNFPASLPLLPFPASLAPCAFRSAPWLRFL